MSLWKCFLIITFCAACLHVCCCELSTATKADSGVELFCVTLNVSDVDYCQGQNFTQYGTLEFYISNKSNFFKSNQKYIFQNGYHSIPNDVIKVTISHVTNLTLTGQQQSTSAEGAIVDCKERALSFVFKHSSNVTIGDITFLACSSHHVKDKGESGHSTLAFIKGFDLALQRIRLRKSVDQALFIENIYGSVVISGVEVVDSNTNGRALKAGNTIKYLYCEKDQSSVIHLSNSKFVNNSIVADDSIFTYAGGLTINLQCPNINVTISDVKMYNNTGDYGGNLAVLLLSNQANFNTSVVIKHSHFEGAHATEGGGMYFEFMDKIQDGAMSCTGDVTPPQYLLYVHNSNFTNNRAEYAGAGVYLRQKQSLTTCHPKTMKFVNVRFTSNVIERIGFGGIAVHSINFMVTDYLNHLYPQYKVVLDECRIHNNHVKVYSRDGSGTGAIFTKSNNYFQIKNTSVFNNKATGILGMSSNIILSGNITITNNTGSSGGGLLLCQNAVMYLDDHTNVTITNNRAIHTGGGISVETDYLQSKPICFFQLAIDPLKNSTLAKTVNVTVYNNHASFAGDNIFGGSIKYCYMIDSPKHKANRSTDIYDAVFHVPSNKESPSSVTSPPHHVCFCAKNQSMTNCSVQTYDSTKPIYPGEIIAINMALVGQYDGSVPGTVRAILKHPMYSKFQPHEDVQRVNGCTVLQYTIYTNLSYEAISFIVQQVGDISGFNQIKKSGEYKLIVTLRECPMGFTLIHNKNITYCGCSYLLRHYKVSCYIRNQTILRSPPEWIGYIERENGTKEVAFHRYCPFDYCSDKITFLNVTESSIDQDKQCASHRIGVLCGSCQKGFSLVSAGSECRTCSNYWLIMYVVYALLGIAILIVLTVINFTISEGTLSGIIFYCNIVNSNFSILFYGRSVSYLTPTLKFFVSFVNIESGLSHCLYNGMDAYVRAWISYTFPLYIWLIAGVLIWLGGRCSWIVRRNAVKVLATLILLSYTRLLDTVAESLQVRLIETEDGSTERRWVIDGNVRYFEGKHTALVIFAIFLSLILLPFTLCLTFIKCLQSVSHYKGFRWINKFKPFFDAYTGPFTSRARCWTGLLLLARGIICVVSAVNTDGDPKVILGTISLVVILLLVFVSILPNGLYRRRWLNTLECLSLLNLGVLATLLYVFNDKKYLIISITVVHTCVSVALLLLFSIIIYHVIKLKVFQYVMRRCCCHRMALQFRSTVTVNRTSNVTVTEIDTSNFPQYEPFNEEREPLLAADDDELVNYSS